MHPPCARTARTGTCLGPGGSAGDGPRTQHFLFVVPASISGTWNRWQQVPLVPLRSAWRPKAAEPASRWRPRTLLGAATAPPTSSWTADAQQEDRKCCPIGPLPPGGRMQYGNEAWGSSSGLLSVPVPHLVKIPGGWGVGGQMMEWSSGLLYCPPPHRMCCRACFSGNISTSPPSSHPR